MNLRKVLKRVCVTLIVLYGSVVALVYFRQRSLLYFPSHGTPGSTLVPWVHEGQVIGYCRPTPHPDAVWLMLHGNGGQAAGRAYVLPHLSERDALFVVEYPGYGARPGSPTRDAIDRAAGDAYRALRSQHPDVPVCVLGESLGSGPASALAHATPPPAKIALVVPYDALVNVAAETFSWLPVRLMLKDRWDNVAALQGYQGPVEIFAARDDTVIPFAHAAQLARGVPAARLVEIEGGHNDWSHSPLVKLRR